MTRWFQQRADVPIKAFYQVEISEQIIEAIKNSDGYEYSENGYTTTIEKLDELLPGLSRHLIVRAIIGMDGVEVIDSMTGAINFSAVYFG